MSTFDPKIDEAFRDNAELELRCHLLLSEGKGDTVEFSAAEDRMTVLWEKLDDMQRRSLSGMASDLNWLRRDCMPAPRGRKMAEEVTEAEQQEWVNAMNAKEWHKSLHYLRLGAPLVPTIELAQMRGTLYSQLGFSNVARVFDAKALELEPEKPAFV